MSNTKQLDKNKGKFIGVATKDGRTYNAQYLRSSPQYLYFRNTRNSDSVKIHKSNLKSFSANGKTYS